MEWNLFLGYSYTDGVASGAQALCRAPLNCPLGQAPGFTYFLPFPAQHQQGGLRSPPGLEDPGTKASTVLHPHVYTLHSVSVSVIPYFLANSVVYYNF